MRIIYINIEKDFACLVIEESEPLVGELIKFKSTGDKLFQVTNVNAGIINGISESYVHISENIKFEYFNFKTLDERVLPI